MAAEYGFNPLPRSPSKILKGHNKDSPYIPITDIAVPDTKVVRAVDEFVKKELNTETYNHSVRVYYYGVITAMTQRLIIKVKQLSKITSRNGSIHRRHVINSE